MGAGLGEVEDEFAEEGVGPGEPVSGEFGGVVFPEGFVDEAGAGVGFFEGFEAGEDFGVVGGSDGLGDDAEGPDPAEADVGAADAGAGVAGVEVGVVGGEDEFAGVLVDFIGAGAEAEVGEGEEVGDVGVVHEEVGAEAVDFVGVHLAEFRMIDNSRGLNGFKNIGCDSSYVSTCCDLSFDFFGERLTSRDRLLGDFNVGVMQF